MTAMSVVPPPMSTTMLPDASVIGMPAPIAAAMPSSIRCTSLAFARYALSLTARRSTCVISDGARPDEALALVRLADEVAEHPLRRFEVGDDAIAHRLDRRNVAGRAPEHL